MAQSFNKFFFFMLLILFGCKKESTHSLVDLIEKKYANFPINDYANKKKIVDQLKKIDFKDENISKIRETLNLLNDGHVYLAKKGETFFKYQTDLAFVPGSNLIQSCLKSCQPSLKGKYKIISIDNVGLEKFYEINKFKVFASTIHGRRHRVFQSLILSPEPILKNLLVESYDKKILEVKLTSALEESKSKACVEGIRLSNKDFLITINSLWCDQGTLIDSKKIFQTFKSQWDDVIVKVNESDRIILDLRENNGGGDQEVMLVLNTFISNKILVYRYQLLKETIHGVKETFFNITHPNKGEWVRKEDLYLDKNIKPIKFLFSNKITTLISPGCFSSCEGLAGNLKVHKRSILVGQRTHGGLGEPTLYQINSTPFMVNLPANVTWLSNNQLVEGVGIFPDFDHADQNKNSYDEVLNFALLK